MQTCETCVHRCTSLTTKKMWKCKMRRDLKNAIKRFNHPKLNGWFCPFYMAEIEDRTSDVKKSDN